MSDEDEVQAGVEKEEVSDGFATLVKEFLASKTWTTVVMTATFFALFQVDICNMYFSKQADIAFGYMTLGWFVVFLFEMSMNFIMGLDYGANPGLKKFTFYFFLDLVGTLSLIPDFVIIFGITFPSSGSAMLARVARTARVGEPPPDLLAFTARVVSGGQRKAACRLCARSLTLGLLATRCPFDPFDESVPLVRRQLCLQPDVHQRRRRCRTGRFSCI